MRLETFLDDLQSADKLDSTLLLLGSKQGQGPVDPKTLVVSDPQTVVDGAGVPVAFFVGEDGGIVSFPYNTPQFTPQGKANTPSQDVALQPRRHPKSKS